MEDRSRQQVRGPAGTGLSQEKNPQPRLGSVSAPPAGYHSHRQLAGDGEGVAPLQGPVLPPLSACNGPGWLLCGDPVPAVSEAGSDQWDPETITLQGMTNSVQRAQSTGSSDLVTLRWPENEIRASWLSANKITLSWCSPVKLGSSPRSISSSPDLTAHPQQGLPPSLCRCCAWPEYCSPPHHCSSSLLPSRSSPH